MSIQDAGCACSRIAAIIALDGAARFILSTERRQGETMSFAKRTIAAAAVITITALASSSAQAVTVGYTTTGVFGSNGLSSVTVSDSLPNTGSSTLSFAGTSQSTDLTGLLPAFFGTFNLSSTSVIGNAFSDTFKLTITQSLPVAVPNTGDSEASVSGTVSTAAGSGVLIFTFVPSEITIGGLGGVKYTLPSIVSLKMPGTTSVELTGSLNVPGGTPNVVPLPGALAAGSALFGTLGIARLRRRTIAD